MAVIDDILGKKKNTGPAGVIRNEEDNSTGSRGGVVRQAMPKPEGVQAPVVTPAPKVAGIPTEGMKPLPTAPEPPKPATPSNEPETDEGNGAVTTPKPQKPQPSEPRQRYTYEDIEAMMGETEEQKKAREKREKRQAVLATIADGLAAFHNSYAHARGIKPMQNIGGNSSKLAQRLYQEQKDREAKGLKLYDMKQRAEQMEDTRNWRKAQEGLNKKALEVREGELQARKDRIALDDWTSQWKRDIAQGTLDIKKRQQEIDEAFKQGQISIQARNAASNELKAQADMLRAQKSGNTKVEEVDKDIVYDSMGRVTGTSQRKTTRQEGTNNSDSGGGGKSGFSIHNNGKQEKKSQKGNFSIHK